MALTEAVARELARAFQILAIPAKTVAHAFNRNANLFKHAVLAKAGGGHFHELEDLDFLAMHMGAAKGAQCEPKRGSAFAFPVTRVDDQQAPPLTLGFFIGLVFGRCFDLHGKSPNWGQTRIKFSNFRFEFWAKPPIGLPVDEWQSAGQTRSQLPDDCLRQHKRLGG